MKSKINNKNLLRPLLDQKKKDLEFISKFVFDFYVKDPSNENEKYQRIKIRKLIEELKTNGLDKKKFLKTIKNLKDSNSVVNFYVNENLIENTYFSTHSNKLIINEKFFQQPHEIIFRSFSDSIKLIGKKHYSVRGKKLDKIIYDIKRNELFRATIGNCIIEKVNQSIIITKEH